MTRPPGVRRLFRLARKREPIDEIVDQELRHHVQECEEFLIERGFSRRDAYLEARRRFGDLTSYRSVCVSIGRRRQRRQNVMQFVHSIIQDIRFAVRGMRRYPVFTISVILTLALGIGANAAIFTIFDATMLRPPPFPNVERLATVAADIGGNFLIPQFRTETARTIQRGIDATTIASAPRQSARTDLDVPETFNLHLYDPAIFEVLGISTIAGRPFTRNDVGPMAEPVAVISHAYWNSRFNADPTAIGQEIRIDDVPFTIIGVLPRGIKYPRYSSADAWVPFDQNGMVAGTENAESTVALLALNDESRSMLASEEQAQGAVLGMIERGEVTGMEGIRFQPVLEDGLNPDSRRALWILMGACGLMWLIAVVNGTNLFLVRNTVRLTEIRVRLALGAGRLRIMRQILSEAFVLAMVSGIISAVVATLTMGALVASLPSEINSFSHNSIEISNRVVTFVFLLAAATGLLFGLVPAIAAIRGRSAAHGDSLTRTTTSRSGLAMRSGLVVLQITLAMVLLVGATLLTTSFVRLSRVDPGFDARGVLSMVINLPESRYPTPASRSAFREDVLLRLASIPGVTHVTQGSGLPGETGFSFGNDSIHTDGGQLVALSQSTWISQARVDHQYYEMMSVDVVAGRSFRLEDAGRTDIVMIDEDLASRLFGSPAAAVDRQIRYGSTGTWYRVIGVTERTLLLSPAGSPNAHGLSETQTNYSFYRPVVEPRTYMVFGVKVSEATPNVAPMMREAVASVDALQPVTSITPVEHEYAETFAKPRFNSHLMLLLAGLSMILTLIGVYGVLSFAVSSRARELGIRLALGAPRVKVRRLVLSSGLRLSVLGVLLGIGITIPLSRTTRSLLYNTPTDNGVVFALTGLMVVVAGLLAAYLPSRRAMKVDPAHILRAE